MVTYRAISMGRRRTLPPTGKTAEIQPLQQSMQQCEAPAVRLIATLVTTDRPGPNPLSTAIYRYPS